ncbi:MULTISPECIES: H-NS family nucleoid-associated regulatory protein [Snodgrassella]|uniref:H-NS family nucleoid-associated regulatory protein n=1 Tax=Snodgrassella TaxID=1193515 RepID=UPI0008157A34|nr:MULTISPECIES: H-NS family nucleoid-associated regulatory protein [Snodgrassella]MCO6521221.1 H-NS histone family protein [Snodgrassella sp.]SCC04057.1 H-NS histone family protein [Snodgrassella sp. R-53583]
MEYNNQTRQNFKYKNPKTGETWVGKGRKPLWVLDWEKAGCPQDKMIENPTKK